MHIGYLIVAIVLVAGLLGSGYGKLTHAKSIVESLTRVGVPPKAYLPLAGCEFAGAAGLIIGIWIAPLGLAAAIGTTVYFLLATVQHVRKGDPKGAPPAVFLLLLSVASLVLVLPSL